MCNKCGAELPPLKKGKEEPTYGSICLVCGVGTYNQHEDALSLQINKLTDQRGQREANRARLMAAGNTAHEATIAEVLNTSDAAGGVKG